MSVPTFAHFWKWLHEPGGTVKLFSLPTPVQGVPIMATVLDVITGAESDATSAATAALAALAALAADQAAQAAATQATASKSTEAAALHSVGEVYVKQADGSIVTYDSPDGINIQKGTPKDASTVTLPDPTPAPVPAP